MRGGSEGFSFELKLIWEKILEKGIEWEMKWYFLIIFLRSMKEIIIFFGILLIKKYTFTEQNKSYVFSSLCFILYLSI